MSARARSPSASSVFVWFLQVDSRFLNIASQPRTQHTDAPMHQTPGRRAAVPIAAGQQRHPRESLSEGVSIGPEPLLQTLAVTSPRVRTTATPSSRGTGAGRTGRSKLASVVHPSATDLQGALLYFDVVEACYLASGV